MVFGDLRSKNVGPADVVTLYLQQDTDNRLASKLWAELRSGARVFSHSFTLPGRAPAGRDDNEYLYLFQA